MLRKLSPIMAEEEQKSLSRGIWIAVVVALAIAAAVAYAFRGKAQKQERLVRENLQEVTVAADEVNILGNYMIRLQSEGGAVSRVSGYIDTDAVGNYMLYILSEYDPQVYPLTLCDDGTIFNADLGEGRMTFRRNVGKTSIVFSNDGNTCTLIK